LKEATESTISWWQRQTFLVKKQIQLEVMAFFRNRGVVPVETAVASGDGASAARL